MIRPYVPLIMIGILALILIGTAVFIAVRRRVRERRQAALDQQKRNSQIVAEWEQGIWATLDTKGGDNELSDEGGVRDLRRSDGRGTDAHGDRP